VVGLSVAHRFVVSSSSAFTDDLLLKELRQTAAHHGSQLVLSPGAVAGIDALSAASRLALSEVRHRIVKSPRSWGSSLDERERTQGGASILFSGSARECARRYPLNANVTVVSALSGIGLDATQVELVSDPLAVANRHEIHVCGEFGRLSITVENRPLQANPKSSELAALALVRLAENEGTDLVI
jgi:aspartate dehydrogenase